MAQFLFDHRCQVCGWTRTVESDVQPPPVACADCGSGADVRWWRKRPKVAFVPSEAARQLKYLPVPRD